MDKFPINYLEIAKDTTKYKNVNEILEYFKDKIESHDIATYISIFDHYNHTKSINGDINSDILDAKNIIFCFGGAIPKTEILAVRPRAFGIAEKKESFIIEFMDAPNDKLTEVMQEWTKGLMLQNSIV